MALVEAMRLPVSGGSDTHRDEDLRLAKTAEAFITLVESERLEIIRGVV